MVRTKGLECNTSHSPSNSPSFVAQTLAWDLLAPLHSPEGAAKGEGLGVSCYEHQWWDGEMLLVPKERADATSLLLLA